MYKKYLVRQNSQNDCASACLLSIMKYYGLDSSLDEISYILKTNKNGTNALNLINGSRTFGFDGFGVHYSFDDIINNQVNFPIICHVRKNNMYHFIVVYECKKNYLIIMDPSTNKMKLNKLDFKNMYLGTVIVIYPVKKYNCEYNNKKLYEFIFDYIKLEKINIIRVIILSIIVILLSILTNYYFYLLLDNNYNYLILITIFFINVFLVKDILDYIKNRYFINIEISIYNKMNIEIIRKLFNLPYLFFKNKSTGEVESRINDLKIFKELVSEFIISLLINVLFIIISFIILFNINIKLTLINLFGIILYSLIVGVYKIIFDSKTNEILMSEGNYKKSLIDNINSYEINKNLNLINDKNKEIEISFIKYNNKVKSYEYKLNNKNIFKNILFDLVYIINIYYGIKLIRIGGISLSLLILFNSVLYYFIEPFKSIIDLSPNLEYLKNTYRRIYDLLIMKEENSSTNAFDIKGDISINSLSYSFNGYDKVIDNINICIPYKSKYLIYGDSGVGKSTVIKILLKYINDYTGDVLVNNINLKDISRNNIANSFTYISQNNYIINDTLKNNIIYGRNIKNSEYEKVIEVCNLNNLRDSTKSRNDMIIEENGFNISGGQKQKIILARSLLKKSNYLILDEALSEISVEEEKQIIEKLFNIYEDRTIIYISHKKEIIDLFSNKYYLERSKGNDIK